MTATEKGNLKNWIPLKEVGPNPYWKYSKIHAQSLLWLEICTVGQSLLMWSGAVRMENLALKKHVCRGEGAHYSGNTFSLWREVLTRFFVPKIDVFRQKK
jgi:hypothetical protein